MKNLDKLMDKKKGDKEIDPMHKAAKMSMLKSLRDDMVDMMKGDLENPSHMKKVEVASSDKEGLEAGLDKAKEMLADHNANSDELGQDEEDEHDVKTAGPFGVSPDMEESAEEGDSESPEHEGEMDYSRLSPEEETLMKKLLAKAKGMK